MKTGFTSIIITTCGDHLEDCLRPCLSSLIPNTDLTKSEIIIVANGCGKETKEYVESLGIYYKLLWYEDLIGYPRALNVGIKEAEGEFIVLLNDDTEILGKNWIQMLMDPFADPSVGITGPIKMINYDINRFFLINFCVMFKREVFDKVGPFDELFSPGAGEDSVVGNTPIVIKKNSGVDIIPIGELYTGNEDGICSIEETEIYSKIGWTKVNYCSKHTVNKPIIRTRTKQGIINTTPDHSLMYKNLETKPTKNLIGKKIDLVKLPIIVGKSSGDAWFDGLFVAEGSASINRYKRKNPSTNYRTIYNQTVCCVKIDMKHKKTILAISKRYKWGFFKHIDKRNGCVMYRAYMRDKNLKEITLEWRKRFYNKYKEKKIPKDILNGSLDDARLFLDGFFVGDGHLSKRKNRRDKKMFTTTSPSLALGIQFLLSKLGYKFSVGTRKDKKDYFNIKILLGGIGSNATTKRNSEPLIDDGTVLEVYDVTKWYVNKNGSVEVFDATTKDATFMAGIGGIIAHNTDFCIKAEDAGYKLVQVPEEGLLGHNNEKGFMLGGFPIYHKGEATLPFLPGIPYNETQARNRKILADRYGKG